MDKSAKLNKITFQEITKPATSALEIMVENKQTKKNVTKRDAPKTMQKYTYLEKSQSISSGLDLNKFKFNLLCT